MQEWMKSILPFCAKSAGSVGQAGGSGGRVGGLREMRSLIVAIQDAHRCGNFNEGRGKYVPTTTVIWAVHVHINYTFLPSFRRLPAKYVNHPYFLVALNDINACRTRVKEAPNPIFDEEYTLDDLPGELFRRE